MKYFRKGTVSSALALSAGILMGMFSFTPLVSLAGGIFYVDGTTGYLGLGNTSPQSRLDVSGAIYSRLVTATSSTIDWNAGNVQTMTLSSSPTLTFSNAQAGGKYDLILVQDGTGGRTVTWPASVKWQQGNSPILSTAANATDTVSFIYDGGSFLGTYGLNYQTPSATVAFDAATSAETTGTTGTLSWTHTTSGTNRFLVVACRVFDGDYVSGITYNGVALTQATKIIWPGNDGYEYLYYLPNPASGAHSVTATFTSGHNLGCNSASYTGAQQTTGVDVASVSETASGDRTVTVNVTHSGSWLVETHLSVNVGPTTAVNGTLRTGSIGENDDIVDSNATVGAGNHTIGYHWAASDAHVILGISIAPAY